MTVESLRRHLSHQAPDGMDSGPFAQLLEALARFEVLPFDQFVAFLEKVKLPAVKKPAAPRPPKKTPEQVAEEQRRKDNEKANKERVAQSKKEAAAEAKRLKDKQKLDSAAAKKEAAERAKQAKQEAADAAKRVKEQEKTDAAAAQAATVGPLAAQIEQFIASAMANPPKQSDIDRHVAAVGKLDPAQIRTLAHLLKCDAGLAKNASKKVVHERIRIVISRAVGMAARVDQ